MRPSRIHAVAAIPRLASGKLDARALEALARDLEGEAADGTRVLNKASDVRQAVHRAWRIVLGRRSLADGRSFEDAGGDSLKMLQLVLWLETLRRRRLPLDLFTGDMNADDFIHIVEDFERQSGGSCHVDGRPTIFLFPGLDGDEPRLANFRAELSDRFRIILIEYPDWPEMVRRGQSFDVLIELAVSQITATQPHGPLLLAGYSFGGDVAFAAATGLLRLERRIGFLGILDTDLQAVDAEAALSSNRGFFRSFREVMRTPHDRASITIGFLLAKCARDMFGLEYLLRSRVRPALLPNRIVFAFHRRIRTIQRLQAQWQWHRSTSPIPISTPAVLFCSGRGKASSSVDRGWRTRCPGIMIEQVGGDHRSMLDPPHRAALCAQFAQSVERLSDETVCFETDWRSGEDSNPCTASGED